MGQLLCDDGLASVREQHKSAQGEPSKEGKEDKESKEDKISVG
jgi:hypothetical protein